ncbi:amino acid permease [Gilliamella sp. B3791]|uniref:APC family permease n=1 Tax=unclassified Gilliamella TaxID=2685620 RepID=UPI002269A541|nr:MULTISPECIES: amino acid permease [unclassified Gilliamella]MCX8642976.1 amino acid permease [Gilliamella sp. B3835]MCX8708367.1 amino acid permease [Gilliamella sp. B3783]MCX8709849.1 amino acid permease [Gilliamella sp. B3780]MCX8712886.1 amino acid permease [Gilliamella sp. B3468]MCX8717563.1 amino acid permease [Gilliamella sp. B3784]
MSEHNLESKLRKDLGLVSALSLVVGMVLGAGAFMKPPAVLAVAGDYNYALLAWIIGGIFSICGGLTLCELGVMFPKTGGMLVYLEKIYGPKIAHLYGWMITVLFAPSLVGALVGYFSSVFCLLFNIDDSYRMAVSAGVLGFIAFINAIGVKQAGYLQTLATVCKLIPILLLAVFGLWKGNGQVALFGASGQGIETFAPFAVAILATLFAYDGWAQVASVAGEIHNPAKVLPKAIILGIIFLVIVYACINIALFKIFPVQEMVTLGHDASAVASQRMFGHLGGNLVAVGIMVSILGGINGYIMTLSRTIFSMAERGTIIGARYLSTLDEASRSPVNAISVLVVFAFLYSILLDADRLSEISMFSIWVFYLLTFIGVIIARKKYADIPRSYKVIAYPIVPIMAIIGAIYVIYGMLVYQTFNGIASIVLTLLGLPLYYYYHSKNKNRELSLGEMKKYRTKTQYLIAIATVFVVLLLAICGYIINK